MGVIYKISNLVNGDFYIGMTRDRDTRRRWRKHKTNALHLDTYLYRAMRKYGIDQFTIETIEETAGDPEALEIQYIGELSPPYNMTAGGDGGDTSQSPNYKAGMGKRDLSGPKNGMYGKPSAMRGRDHPAKGKPMRKNMCPVICEGTEYESVGAAEAAYPGIKVRSRLDNPKYPDFYRLGSKTLRK